MAIIPLTTTITTYSGKPKTVFSRVQTSTAQYLEAINQTPPLTMLTAEETRRLSLAGQQLVSTDETLIYKYREEFLHIQQVAERGLTQLDLLLEDPKEFKILAESWGFTVVVRDRYNNAIVYTKNLNQTEFNVQLSNASIDWSKPNPPTVDVEYYRYSGNLVNLADSTLLVPNIDSIKARFNVNAYLASAGSTSSNTLEPNRGGTYSVQASEARYSGSGFGGVFNIQLSVVNGQGQSYTFYKGSAAGGEGYVGGEKLLIPGSYFGGASPANDAIITIQTVGRTIYNTGQIINGVIISAIISGTTPSSWYPPAF